MSHQGILLSWESVAWELKAWEGSLTVGFYNTTCPRAEETIRNAITTAFEGKLGVAITTALNGTNGSAASLIRLHFHDCFVGGCDVSVLLKASTANPSPENNPVFNLRGFELIDPTKAAVEAICPGVVSCADILTFTARDAFHLLTTPGACLYDVPAGRRDGTVSSFQEALVNLPPPAFNLAQLKRMFESKNFSLDELITLSGAHSIGRDHVTPDVLDVQYYTNVLNNRVLFFSDYSLTMQKLSQFKVLTGTQGQIRKACSAVN
ncbi:hypothetical protein LUZ63_010251 [Rhynchospora breviuscula]|uniref:Plant heme peroxidase family profile domain-containing protein n=1 Tax=Rhynchospora breviuscula TaxID=2022672 RepID=A0A9Q0HPS4_9POAL|nr:hypothetical protein LUZ63_010251 [Rhynchospora breviuscula]